MAQRGRPWRARRWRAYSGRSNRLRNVFRRQPACQEKLRDKLSYSSGNIPINNLSSPASRLACVGIKQDRICFILTHTLRLKITTGAQSLDDEAFWPQRATVLWRFVAVQLHSTESDQIGNARNLLRLALINEDADAQHFGRQLLQDAPRVLRRDIARATPIEIESERVRASFDRCERVFQIRYAADFDEHLTAI